MSLVEKMKAVLYDLDEVQEVVQDADDGLYDISIAVQKMIDKEEEENQSNTKQIIDKEVKENENKRPID